MKSLQEKVVEMSNQWGEISEERLCVESTILSLRVNSKLQTARKILLSALEYDFQNQFTIEVIRKLTLFSTFFPFKSWSNWLTKDSFEICMSWGFWITNTCLIWWSFGWDIQGRRPFLCDFYCIHNLVFRKCYKYFLFLFYYYDFRFTVYLFIRGIMLHLVFQQNILNIQIYFLKIQIR